MLQLVPYAVCRGENLKLTRRSLATQTGAVLAMSLLPPSLRARTGSAAESKRPLPAARKFRSTAVEDYITATNRRIRDPELSTIFTNCYPNTLDTTVEPGVFEGKPDTAVITGDIPAMWLRDSSAQVWPYLPLAVQDDRLRALLEGVIRRQTRCLLIDTYANSFMADLNAAPLAWSLQDKTEMKPGVGERKYELDSLCYPIRLAHGYWKQTGDTRPSQRRQEIYESVVRMGEHAVWRTHRQDCADSSGTARIVLPGSGQAFFHLIGELLHLFLREARLPIQNDQQATVTGVFKLCILDSHIPLHGGRERRRHVGAFVQRGKNGGVDFFLYCVPERARAQQLSERTVRLDFPYFRLQLQLRTILFDHGRKPDWDLGVAPQQLLGRLFAQDFDADPTFHVQLNDSDAGRFSGL
jgi:hypothetical protein